MHGGGFFQGRDLDYWREGNRVPHPLPSGRGQGALARPAEALPPPSPNVGLGSVIRQRDSLPFDWSRYEDPRSPEFWDDGGDYVPPRPLREAVSNPTPANLDAYVAWQARRLEVLAAFETKMAQNAINKLTGSAPSGVISRATDSATDGAVRSQGAAPHDTQAAIKWKELELLYFYQSSCPHCVAQKEHVETLAKRGVRISFIQMDAGERPPLHVRSVPYTQAHSNQFRVTATPTWVFRRHGRSVRLQGEQSEGEIAAQLSTLFQASRHHQPQERSQ